MPRRDGAPSPARCGFAYLPQVAAVGSLLGLPHITDDLERVEAQLRASAQSDDAFLTQVASHLIEAGGKRLRPALALASGYLARSPASDEMVMGAVAVELVHLGSLYHDDVMDEAATRRGVPSVNARWGNLVAILAGDLEPVDHAQRRRQRLSECRVVVNDQDAHRHRLLTGK